MSTPTSAVPLSSFIQDAIHLSGNLHVDGPVTFDDAGTCDFLFLDGSDNLAAGFFNQVDVSSFNDDSYYVNYADFSTGGLNGSFNSVDVNGLIELNADGTSEFTDIVTFDSGGTFNDLVTFNGDITVAGVMISTGDVDFSGASSFEIGCDALFDAGIIAPNLLTTPGVSGTFYQVAGAVMVSP